MNRELYIITQANAYTLYARYELEAVFFFHVQKQAEFRERTTVTGVLAREHIPDFIAWLKEIINEQR